MRMNSSLQIPITSSSRIASRWGVQEAPGSASSSPRRPAKLAVLGGVEIEGHPELCLEELDLVVKLNAVKSAKEGRIFLHRLPEAHSSFETVSDMASIILKVTCRQHGTAQPTFLRLGPRGIIEQEMEQAKRSHEAFGAKSPKVIDFVADGPAERHGSLAVLQLELAGGRCLIPGLIEEGLQQVTPFATLFSEAMCNASEGIDAPAAAAMKMATQQVCGVILAAAFQRAKSTTFNLLDFANVETLVIGKDANQIGAAYFDGTASPELEEKYGSILGGGASLQDLSKMMGELLGKPQKPSAVFSDFWAQMTKEGAAWRLRALVGPSHCEIGFDSVLQDGDGRAWLSGVGSRESGHVYSGLARWLASGLLEKAEGNLESRHYKELFMTLAAIPEDLGKCILPPCGQDASHEARLLWSFARVTLSYAVALLAGSGVDKMEKPGLQFLWVFMDIAVEIVASTKTREFPERKRVALWAASCCAVRLWSSRGKLPEPTWLQHRRAHWNVAEDPCLADEEVVARNYLADFAAREAWGAAVWTGSKRSILEDEAPFDFAPPHQDEEPLKQLRGTEDHVAMDSSFPTLESALQTMEEVDVLLPEVGAGLAGGALQRSLMRAHRRLLVSGALGAGKTTTARRLLVGLAADQIQHGFADKLPLRVSVSSWLSSTKKGLLDPLSVEIAKCSPAAAVALAWERPRATHPWCSRTGHQVADLGKGHLVLIAGQNSHGQPLQDVWQSLDGGASWEAMPTPPWQARHHHQVVVWEQKIVLLAGKGDEDRRLRDIWESFDFGKTWQELPCPRWNGRCGHQVVVTKLVLPGGSIRRYIVLLAGSGIGSHALKDVWASDNGGYSWTELETPPWTARHSFCATVWDGRLIVTGGIDELGKHLGDTWVMTGVAWRSQKSGGHPGPAATKSGAKDQVATGEAIKWEGNSKVPWPARAHHQAFVFRGLLVLSGGFGEHGELLTDCWATADCARWQQLPEATWKPAACRAGHQALTVQGRATVIGGHGGGGDCLRTRHLLLGFQGLEEAHAHEGEFLKSLDWLFQEKGHLVVIATGTSWGSLPPLESERSPLRAALRRWGFGELRLKPLGEEELKALCRLRLDDLERSHASQIEAELLRQDQRDVASNPLVVNMILQALRRPGASVSDRVELYDYILERCLQSREQAKRNNVTEYHRLREQGAELVAAEIAFEALGRGARHEMGARELSSLGQGEAMDALLKLSHSGELVLLEVPHHGGLRFRFPSTQDFLAAKHVWRQLVAGKSLPPWLTKESQSALLTSSVQEHGVGCARFVCLQARRHAGHLSKERLSELREGLGSVLRSMSRVGDPIAVRCLVEAAAGGQRQILLSQFSSTGHTALHLAALNGHQEVAQTILELAPDPGALSSCFDSDALAPLHCAAFSGREAVVRVMLSLAPDIATLASLEDKSVRHLTCLHHAAKSGHKDVVDTILKLSPHPAALASQLDTSGFTALHFAAKHGHVDVVRLLLPNIQFRNVLLTAQSKFDQQTALHLAADVGEEGVVTTILGLLDLANDRRVLLTMADKLGQTALHLASEKGHATTVTALLSMAPEPGPVLLIRERITGQTALHMAAEAGHSKVVRALLDYAPDKTVLASAADRCGRNTALHLAAEKGHAAAIRTLLEVTPDPGLLLAAPEKFASQTALHLAASAGHDQAVRALLEGAPDPMALLSQPDRPGGFTPLHLASEKGHPRVVESLLELAPDKATLLKEGLERWSGFTALHLAAYRGHEEVAKALLRLAPDKRAMLVAKDSRGRTAGDLAADRGRRGVAALLCDEH